MALFGGDPSRVTLGGLFDGGASAHLHQISPQGRGLYGGIIAQSGTALSGFIEMLKSSKVQRESVRLLKTQGGNSIRISTGLFNPSVNFQIPLISYTHGSILTPFGMVRDICGWFCLVYN